MNKTDKTETHPQCNKVNCPEHPETNIRLAKAIFGDAVTDPRTVAGKYPDQYLHIENCKTGMTWIVPFDDQTPMDIDAMVDGWIQREFCGELQRDGKLIPLLQGDYYAQILTDNRPPDSAVCWTSGGFYLKGI